MNKRNAAIANGMLTYNSGKPCRSGHTSDRYSSNGMCIACLGQQASARKTIVRELRIKHNMGRADGLESFTVNVRRDEQPAIEMLGEILHYSDQSVKDNVVAFLKVIHETCPSPRILDADALLTFMDFDGWSIRNLDDLEMTEATPEDPTVYFIRNGHQYNALHVLEVLRNQRLNVHPTPKRLTNELLQKLYLRKPTA